MKKALERERASKAALSQHNSRLQQELTQVRGHLKRREDELAREKLSFKKAMRLKDEAQSESARLGAENAALRGESEASAKELELLKARLEQKAS